jgi:hypothetical protein
MNAQHAARSSTESRADWYKSSYSGGDNACVEVGVTAAGPAVRDSKQPTGATLTFGSESFASFIASLKA